MDNFEKEHLKKWLETTIPPSERRQAGARIREFVKAYPKVLLKWSWPEILEAARSRSQCE